MKPNRDKTVYRLRLIQKWANLGKYSNGIQGVGCLTDMVNWIDDAIELLTYDQRTCANCEYLSKDFMSVCKNDESYRYGDFVSGATRCEWWNKKRNETGEEE